SLLTAERQWRDELLERRQEFEPDLSRVVGEFNVLAAYHAGQVFRCLEESERLRRAGHASGKVLLYTGYAQMYLGHYAEAAQLFESALENGDPMVKAMEAEAWVGLGNVYDLLGVSAKARAAYDRARAKPDNWFPGLDSAHQRARLHMRRPFTEDDIRKRL